MAVCFTKERKSKSQLTYVTILHSIITEVISHQLDVFCLLEAGPTHTQGQGTIQGCKYWEAWVIEGHLRVCPPNSSFLEVEKVSVQFSSVAQSCPTLCNPTNRGTPALPVHQKLSDFTHTHAHESVMPSNHLILCRPLLFLPPIPPSIRVFSKVNSSNEVAKVLEFQLQHQSFQ